MDLVLGSMIFSGHGPLIIVGPDRLIELQFTEECALLNAQFFDDQGRTAVTVVESELQFCSEAWDIEVIGSAFKVRRGPGEIVFDAVLFPPSSMYVRAINIVAHGWRLVSDDKGKVEITHNSGSRVDFPEDSVAMFGGPLELQGTGLTAQDGSVFAPFPSDRFQKLVRAGETQRLKWEIAEQRIVYVTPVRNQRQPPPAEANVGVQVAVGVLRYPVFCDVCNTTRVGTRDLPQGTPVPADSGILCGGCAGLPPDAWVVRDDRGAEIARFSNKDKEAAIAEGHQFLTANPDFRMVIHGLGNEQPQFVFGDGQ